MDMALYLKVPAADIMEWQKLPQLLHDPKDYFLSYFTTGTTQISALQFQQLQASMMKSQDSLMLDLNCAPSENGHCYEDADKRRNFSSENWLLLTP